MDTMAIKKMLFAFSLVFSVAIAGCGGDGGGNSNGGDVPGGNVPGGNGSGGNGSGGEGSGGEGSGGEGSGNQGLSCTGAGDLLDRIQAQGENDSEPFAICNEDDLNKMGYTKALAKPRNYVLMNDISVSDHTPIGNSKAPFSGSFEGNGHTITIQVNKPDADGAGLFAFSRAIIQNLKVKGTVVAGGIAGGIAGEQIGELRNVAFEGEVVCTGKSPAGALDCGGIAGSLGGTMSNVRAEVELVCGTEQRQALSCSFGGLVGSYTGQKGSGQSYAFGSIESNGYSLSMAGGLVANIANTDKINPPFKTGLLSNSVSLISVVSANCPQFCLDTIRPLGQSEEPVGRIAGLGILHIDYGALNPYTLKNNFARDDMELVLNGNTTTTWPGDYGTDKRNGESVAFTSTQTPEWWMNTLGWAADCADKDACPNVWGGDKANKEKPWKWSADKKLPVLWFE